MWLQEYQSCNTLPCPDLKKTTPWTPWTPVNISDNGGHYEQRFRYTCKARIPDPSLLEVGRQRIEMRYCSSDGSTGCSTDGECRLEETDGLSPAISASRCSVLSLSNWLSASLQDSYWPPSLKLFLLPACQTSLGLSVFPFQTLPLFVLQNLKERYLNQLSCLWSRLPRLYQWIKAPGVLMNFQSTKPISSLQLILALPHTSFTHRDTNTHWCKCSNSNYGLAKKHKHTLYQSSQLFPLAHTDLACHTPGELNAVNVGTNRLLIDKLFMLSSGRFHIRVETGGVALHHSKETSSTDAAVKVCLRRCFLPPRKSSFFFFKPLSLRLAKLWRPRITLSSSVSLGGL